MYVCIYVCMYVCILVGKGMPVPNTNEEVEDHIRCWFLDILHLLLGIFPSGSD